MKKLMAIFAAAGYSFVRVSPERNKFAVYNKCAKRICPVGSLQKNFLFRRLSLIWARDVINCAESKRSQAVH